MKISKEALQGYILEEMLAYLIRNTGYRLLVDDVQDPQELGWERNGLVVKGRGAVHQVDVLGELMWIPAFTFPLRLFVEAKFREEKTGISIVRNAVGAMLDINQNNLPQSTRTNGGNPQLRPKYQYVGAIFSTSGFSQPAMDMALAHGISLVDLGISGFEELLNQISETAQEIVNSFRVSDSTRGEFIHALRSALRNELRTQPHISYEDRNRLRGLNKDLLDKITPSLKGGVDAVKEMNELLVGMGQGPYMIVLKADNINNFIMYATHNPSGLFDLEIVQGLCAAKRVALGIGCRDGRRSGAKSAHASWIRRLS